MIKSDWNPQLSEQERPEQEWQLGKEGNTWLEKDLNQGRMWAKRQQKSREGRVLVWSSRAPGLDYRFAVAPGSG